jgi:hypothetical protein
MHTSELVDESTEDLCLFAYLLSAWELAEEARGRKEGRRFTFICRRSILYVFQCAKKALAFGDFKSASRYEWEPRAAAM